MNKNKMKELDLTTNANAIKSLIDINKKHSNYVLDMLERASYGQDWEYKPTMKIKFTHSETHWFDITPDQLEKIKKVFK